MEEYTYLKPEEKLEKFLEQRNKKNKTLHILTVLMSGGMLIFGVVVILSHLLTLEPSFRPTMLLIIILFTPFFFRTGKCKTSK